MTNTNQDREYHTTLETPEVKAALLRAVEPGVDLLPIRADLSRLSDIYSDADVNAIAWNTAIQVAYPEE